MVLGQVPSDLNLVLFDFCFMQLYHAHSVWTVLLKLTSHWQLQFNSVFITTQSHVN